MFNCIRPSTQTIVVRILVFVLTVSIGQALTSFLRSRPRVVTRVVEPKALPNVGIWYPPLQVETLPDLEFPKSLRKLRAVNFSIESSLLVDADGQTRDILVPSGFEISVEEQSFVHMLRGLSPKQRGLVANEVIGQIQAQLKNAKFKPRSEDIALFPMTVFATSHFRWNGTCQKIETEVQIPNGGVIGKQTSISDEACYEL